jgi:hypothetical protein
MKGAGGGKHGPVSGWWPLIGPCKHSPLSNTVAPWGHFYKGTVTSIEGLFWLTLPRADLCSLTEAESLLDSKLGVGRVGTCGTADAAGH